MVVKQQGKTNTAGDKMIEREKQERKNNYNNPTITATIKN
jgi:hypothetical protein